MAERGVRFVQLYHRGWDQHSNLPKQIRGQCGDTDQATAALVQDLKQRGLLDETLVVWGGEFGRTVYSQGQLTKDNYGRDHHGRCFSMWMAGGGMRGGITHGETDDYCYNIVRDGVHIHDLNATILHCLGIDHTRLTYRFQGRDFRLTDVEGHAVRQPHSHFSHKPRRAAGASLPVFASEPPRAASRPASWRLVSPEFRSPRILLHPSSMAPAEWRRHQLMKKWLFLHPAGRRRRLCDLVVQSAPGATRRVRPVWQRRPAAGRRGFQQQRADRRRAGARKATACSRGRCWPGSIPAASSRKWRRPKPKSPPSGRWSSGCTTAAGPRKSPRRGPTSIRPRPTPPTPGGKYERLTEAVRRLRAAVP